MYSETLFHGSNRSRGEKILQTQQMDITRGCKHWLGDGSYFFTEDFHAYKWIVDMFKDRYEEEINYEKFNSLYLIVKTHVQTEKIRVFDLTKTEHKILFDNVHKFMRSKRKLKDTEFAEGVVLNYMFNELNFADDYDLVKSLFIFNTKRYRKFKTRIGYMPQEQVCIKNLNIVDSINEYNFKEREGTLNTLLKDYYFRVNIS